MKMKKAVLVMDMPFRCFDCPFSENGNYCIVIKQNILYKKINSATGKLTMCPLKELPDHMEICGRYPQHDKIPPSYKVGWNTCLDAIEGGENNNAL